MSYPVNVPMTYTAVPHTEGFAASEHSVEWTFSDGEQKTGATVTKVWTTTGTVHASARAYNPHTKGSATAQKDMVIDTFNWSTFGSLPCLIRYPLTAKMPDGSALVMGGNNADNSSYSNRVFRLAADGTWTELAPMLVGKSAKEMKFNIECPVLNDGRVFVCAEDGTGNCSIEIYNPTSNTWQAAGSVSGAWNYCIKMSDGKILIGLHTVFDPATLTTSQITPNLRHPSISYSKTSGYKPIEQPANLGNPIKPFLLSDGRVCMILPGSKMVPTTYHETTGVWTGYWRPFVAVLDPDYANRTKYIDSPIPPENSPAVSPWSLLYSITEDAPGSANGEFNLASNEWMTGCAGPDGMIYLLAACAGPDGNFSKCLMLPQSGGTMRWAPDCPYNLYNVGAVKVYHNLLMPIGVQTPGTSLHGSMCFDVDAQAWFQSTCPFVQQEPTRTLATGKNQLGFTEVGHMPVVLGCCTNTSPFTSPEIFHGILS